jgi:DNA-binding IclR family transcriptional regulator
MTTDKIQMLDRTVAILDSFSLDQPVQGVRDVARKTGLSSSTAGRIMAYLKDLGILNQDPETLSYMMGSNPLAWAGIYTVTNAVGTLARPILVKLQEKTRETISLYVLEGNERVCVERLESPETVRIVARVGRRIPLYAGSAGKIFLAYLPDARREEILKKVRLVPADRKNHHQSGRNCALTAKDPKQGYASSRGEWLQEAAGVAGPIFDQRGQIAAALTISGPSQRFTSERMQEMAHLVKESAAEISNELGYYPAVKAR